MNYIQTLNTFLDNTDGLKATHVAAFMAIFHYSNKSGWKPWVKISSIQAEKVSRLNKKTWIKAIHELEAMGYIKLHTPEKSASLISIVAPEIWGKNTPDCANDQNQSGVKIPQIWGKNTPDGSQSGVNLPHILNKNKQTEEEVLSFQKKQEPKPARTPKAQPQHNNQPAPVRLPKLKSL